MLRWLPCCCCSPAAAAAAGALLLLLLLSTVRVLGDRVGGLKGRRGGGTGVRPRMKRGEMNG